MPDLKTLRGTYDASNATAEQFSERLAEQLDASLFSHGISLAVPIERRVKSWDSIVQKIERNNLDLSSVTALPDYIGLRIILLFRRDVARVSSLLKFTFQVLDAEDATARLGTDAFGYQSLHLRLKLPTTWLNVPTLEAFADLQAEVQVRTTAQHIWAAASHLLQYKREDAVPPPIRRSISRVSALLETVDLEFERVLEERDAYNARDEVPNEELNVDSLTQILDHLLPIENKLWLEDYCDLRTVLLNSGTRTVRDLRILINDRLHAALEKDRAIVAAIRTHGRKLSDKLYVIRFAEGEGWQMEFVDCPLIDNNAFLSHAGLLVEMLGISPPWIQAFVERPQPIDL